jgi:hypothetical protein
MATRTTGTMITLDREDEKFDLEHHGMRIRVLGIFIDEENRELWFRGTNHFFGGRHEQIRLSYHTGGRLSHYAEVITDHEALLRIDDMLAQALAA